MRTSRRQTPDINTGSTADIAFLLLIFFLVTATIPNDKGLNRKLPPPCPPGEICNAVDTPQRNILEVRINSKNELFVKGEIIPLSELKAIAMNFLDNNGDGSCSHCFGTRDEALSDNPKKAIISLTNDPQTSYQFYIDVQDEITKAYYSLRSSYAKNVFNKSVDELSKDEILEIREAYPFLLSEAQIKSNL
ncbi:biopolymer transporter ExbD [Psychroserpens sp.]|uniref:ExbD/TolR family protein n=1 Tax=Psychroserpens sp. TaxID=2020870 RepID=UPI001AFD1CD4|nr:biopolymer transporter ExbD [Psychroserpens sp.]MBO6606507.1 biopolymer transporter ExbD [Psychroserpens sp.]MBO6630417.1 biopolymer transporter ExbD [Psychroserpens sp.]MBO6653211.1 biopolymer transporter ExbD [Psychroserpens sp.]MBO6680761.1 biopolymer transporter ExbD [Psychroserpens sp.]MBO6750281.1 biopolymer transporter ExbD [Psychroserpens sp.]